LDRGYLFQAADQACETLIAFDGYARMKRLEHIIARMPFGLGPIGIAAVLFGFSKVFITLLVKLDFGSLHYEQASPVWSLLTGSPRIMVFAGLSVLIAFGAERLAPRSRWTGWNLIMLWTGLLMIAVNTLLLPHNWYFDQFYAADRLLMLVLLMLCVRWPGLSTVCLFISLLLIKQLQFPALSHYTFTDKQVFYELALFTALWVPARSLLQQRDETHVVFSWGYLAIWYFLAGFGKLQMGWSDNVLVHLPLSAFNYGWLEGYDSLRQLIYDVMTACNMPLIYLTLLAELVVVLFFWRRCAAYGIMALTFGMHLVIFISTGIFFWKWMVFLLVLAFALHRFVDDSVFRPSNVLLTGGIILVFGFGFQGTKLGWLDSGFTNLYRFHLISDADTLRLDPSFFAPYDLPFAQNRFFYLHEGPTLVNTYGCLSSPDAYQAIRAAQGDADAIREVVGRYGKVMHSDQKTDRLLTFIRRMVANRQIGSTARTLPVYAPSHIYLQPGQRELMVNNRYHTIGIRYLELMNHDLTNRDTLTDKWMLYPL
jgi:hypothetical protein